MELAINHTCRQRILLAVSLLLIPVTSVYGEETPAEDQHEMQSLLAVLNEQTEIATKTRLNADYVPGLVTILHGDDLEGKGVQTVWEALSLVPGIEPSYDRLGNRQVLVRGMGGTFAAGNVKILLNDTPMNSALTANADPVLNMLVAQVERIEVIRGPGSAIHGEFAFAGVIRVVTRQDKGRLFIRGGSFDTYGGGGLYQAMSQDEQTRFTLNLAGWQSRGAGQDSGLDPLTWLRPDLTHSPGPVKNRMEDRVLAMRLDHKNLSLSLNWLEDGHGDHFGTINVLSATDDLAIGNRYLTLEGRGTFNLAADTRLDLTLGGQRYRNVFDLTILPDNFYPWCIDITCTTLAPVLLPNGYRANGYYEESRVYAGADLFWNGWRDHSWLLGVSASHMVVGDSWQDVNIYPFPRTPLVNKERMFREDGLNWPEEGRERNIVSGLLQDEYRFHPDASLTVGFRYDEYNDMGGHLSSRLAGVWRLSERHILKAQYATAFRPPSFYESVWDNAIRPETIETREISYSYKGSDLDGRLTVFDSRVKDHIAAAVGMGFVNMEGADLQGVELELAKRLNPMVSVGGNVTLVEATDRETGKPLASAASHLANLHLSLHPEVDYAMNLWIRFVGARGREEGDGRDKLSGYETVDLTLSRFNLGYPGLTARAGVKNVFDVDNRFPSAMTIDPQGFPVPSYLDDFPQPGRALWFSLSKTF